MVDITLKSTTLRTAIAQAVVKVSNQKISFVKNSQTMMDELFQIVDQSLVYYEPITGFNFPGFSDIVRLKIEQIDNASFSSISILG